MGSYFTYDKKDEFTQTETNLIKTKDIFTNAQTNYIIQKVSQIDLKYAKNIEDSKVKTKNDYENIKIRYLIKDKDFIKNINKQNISKDKSNDACINNIKSKYRIKEIFNKLQKNKLLQIIKYNKNLQKILNIGSNDYKDYCEIEIELIPKLNQYDKFINIFEKEEKKYYHIYFNNSEEEIKRNFVRNNEKITNIKVIIDYQVESFYGLFENCNYIE